MTSVTLAMNLVAAGLGLCICIVLYLLSRMKHDSCLLREPAIAMGLIALGFTISAFASELPLIALTVGANGLHLTASLLFNSALSRHINARSAQIDFFAIAILITTIVGLWYWSIPQPNGAVRVVIFSFASTLIYGRLFLRLLFASIKRQKNKPLWALTIFMGTWSLIMVFRALYWFIEIFQNKIPITTNPVQWSSVLGFMLFLPILFTLIVWLDFNDPNEPTLPRTSLGRSKWNKHHFLTIVGASITLIFSTIGITTIFVLRAHLAAELESLHRAQYHVELISTQATERLRSIEAFLNLAQQNYLTTRSTKATISYLHSAHHQWPLIEDVYIYDLPSGSKAFAQHKIKAIHPDGSGQFQIRISRPLLTTDLRVVGEIVVILNHQALIQPTLPKPQKPNEFSTLVSIEEEKIHAPSDPPISPPQKELLQAIKKSSIGHFEYINLSYDKKWHIAYRKIPDWPLAIIYSYLQDDAIETFSLTQTRLVIGGAFFALALILISTTLLTIELRRRDEQERFLSMLSHELKTPLSVLHMALGNDGPFNPRAKQLAVQSIRDMDAIVHRVIEANRLEHHSESLQISKFDIPSLLADLASISGASERLVTHAEEGLQICTDRIFCSSAIQNLIDNALKYGDTKSAIHIEGIHHHSNGREGVLFSVEHPAGAVGLPDPDKIFRKYYRAPAAHRQTGSGLGLHLVKNIAKLLGGWVVYRPDPAGLIVRFELWLPSLQQTETEIAKS